MRGSLKRSTLRETREGLEQRLQTFVLDTEGDDIIIIPKLVRLPVYSSWGQPLDSEGVEERPLVVGPDENASDSHR